MGGIKNLLLGSKEIIFLLFLLPIIIVIIYITSLSEPDRPPTPINVVSVSPTDKADKVDIRAEIVVTFSRQLEEIDVKNTELRVLPRMFFQKRVSGDKKSLIFSLVSDFNTDQQYTADIVLYDKKYVWKFKTIPKEFLTPEKQAEYQSEADRKTGEIIEERSKKYPWIDKLPITTNRYFVYFDLDTKKFVAKIYVSESTKSQADEQVSELKPFVVNELENIGVDVKNYLIDWQVVIRK